MILYLLRHGRTAYNDERRYQGQLDIPLSPEGESELCAADFSPETVYVSPLRRTWQTARRIFPGARQEIVPELAEMDFGAFDGRTADEMAEDAAYRDWVEHGCTGRCPGGETRAEFSARSCRAVARLAETAAAAGRERLAIVAHGGTQRAVMERLALPSVGYYDLVPPNGGGFLLAYDEPLWRTEKKLRHIGTVRYTGDGAC